MNTALALQRSNHLQVLRRQSKAKFAGRIKHASMQKEAIPALMPWLARGAMTAAPFLAKGAWKLGKGAVNSAWKAGKGAAKSAWSGAGRGVDWLKRKALGAVSGGLSRVGLKGWAKSTGKKAKRLHAARADKLMSKRQELKRGRQWLKAGGGTGKWGKGTGDGWFATKRRNMARASFKRQRSALKSKATGIRYSGKDIHARAKGVEAGYLPSESRTLKGGPKLKGKFIPKMFRSPVGIKRKDKIRETVSGGYRAGKGKNMKVVSGETGEKIRGGIANVAGAVTNSGGWKSRLMGGLNVAALGSMLPWGKLLSGAGGGGTKKAIKKGIAKGVAKADKARAAAAGPINVFNPATA